MRAWVTFRRFTDGATAQAVFPRQTQLLSPLHDFPVTTAAEPKEGPSMKTNEIRMGWNMNSESFNRRALSTILLFLILAPCRGQITPARPLLPNIDKRQETAQALVPSA